MTTDRRSFDLFAADLSFEERIGGRLIEVADDGAELSRGVLAWEEFGADGVELRGQYEPGWDFVLRQLGEAASC